MRNKTGILAVLGAIFLTGCVHEVQLTPLSREEHVEALPLSAKIEISESVSSGKVPIVFDLKPAAEGYFRNRGTFREVVESGADVVLKIRSRLAVTAPTNFTYAFELQGTLQGGGRLLGAYHVQCSAEGGQIRLTAAADRVPMNKALNACLDDLASQIEANGPSLLAKMRGSARDSAAALQPASALPASPSPTFASPDHPDDLAVIVGIESYSEISSKAPYAERDADAFKAHVRALGVPERNIVLLKGSRAGRASLVKNVEQWLPRLAKPDSRVYFYFSGHGAPDVKTGQAYLVPWDGDPNFLESTAYPLAQLYRKLGELPARQVLVTMDSCFSGAGGRSVLASGARPLVGRIDAGAAPAKITVLAASAVSEISGSLDDKGHGAFTYFLLEGLDSGKATPKSLIEYLTPRVQDEARRLNRDQTPQLQGDGDWSLR